MKDVTIFYSWQSEDKKTKNFIDKALKGAIEDIGKNEEFSQPLTLDRDTQGVIGSPHIVQTILSKIDACEIFVADTSIIDVAASGKKQINQNVMFELGYAIAKHTELNVITLFNEDTGAASDRPFDLSHHRALTFSASNDKKGDALRKELKRVLLLHLNAEKSQIIPGHDDSLYLRLKNDVANFLLGTASIAQRDLNNDEDSLDEIEVLIMKIFADMSDDKRIMVVRTMGGGVLVPASKVDNDLSQELDSKDTEEIIAYMNALVEKNVLAVTYGAKGTPNYRLAKAGFEIIKKMKP
jgi:nucleoside 2-deoxyribosyltransferase